MQTSNNKYIKLAEKYMDNVARHYDPVPQESAIIDFAIWLDKQAAEQSVQRTGLTQTQIAKLRSIS